MKKIKYGFKWFCAASVILSFISCASAEKEEACPTEAEEAISVCRARQKCRSQNSSVGVGVGLGLGHFGLGVGRSQSTDRYERCLDRDLAEQKEKSKQSPQSP